ncbi:MAG: flavodoxin family protein [Bacteroidota bacterium]
MKVIAINGSPKAEGNTWHALNIIGNELKAQGIEFEILHVGHKAIHGCTACGQCAINKDEKCSQKNDIVNESIQKLKEADGFIIASPVYYSGIAGTMKSFLDRVFYVSGANGNLFRHKVAAAITAVRRTGGSSTFDQLNHYLTYGELILATANYWNVIHGRTPGEVLQDHEGSQTMRVLGRNMAWLLKMKEASAGIVSPPEKEQKVITNFVR